METSPQDENRGFAPRPDRLVPQTPEHRWVEELEAPQSDEQEAGAALALGRLAAAEGELERAAVLLRRAAEVGVRMISPRALVHLVPVLESLDRTVEADHALIAAQAGSDPEHTPDVSLDVAAIMVQRSQRERAVQVLRSVVDAWPGGTASDDDSDMARAVAALRLGNLLAEEDDIASASESWRRAMDSNYPAVTPLAALRLADASVARAAAGTLAETEELYRIAIDFDHPVASPQAALRLAAYLRSQQQPRQAIEEYNSLIPVGGEIGRKAQVELARTQEEIGASAGTGAPKLVWKVNSWARGAVSQQMARVQRARKRQQRILIVGAGTGGKYLLRDLDRTRYDVIGLIDDAQVGLQVEGVPVLAEIEQLPEILDAVLPEAVLIAIPTMAGERRALVVDACLARGVAVKNLPSMFELMRDRNLAYQLRDVRVEETMGRQPLVIDRGAGAIVRGRSVMVTGAGSTLDEELSRQIVHARARHLAVVASSTTALRRIESELGRDRGFARAFSVLGACDHRDTMRRALELHRPEIVFHVAGHSQAVVVERNSVEAMRTDVVGTREFARLCGEHGVKRFVFVSSEDAAEPTTVFGACKALAEHAMIAARAEHPQTDYLAVRVGNMYRSSGSVVEVFERQIDLGGPVTLTDGEASRRFMRSQLATQLLLRTAALPGLLYALVGGEEVKIADLAARMIALRGYEIGEIGIENIGSRPGEQSQRTPYSSPRERPAPTEIAEVLEIKHEIPPVEEIDAILDRVEQAVEEGNPAQVLHLIASDVKALLEFAPETRRTQAL